MWAVIAVTAAWLWTSQGAGPALPPELQAVLDRVSEEAEVFVRLAPRVVGQEILEHRGRKNPPRFRPRIGAEPPPVRYQTRQIVSEYGFGWMKGSPEGLLEFRQVVSVDGKPVRPRERARLKLAENITSESDLERRRMLEEFERYGTIGAATDLGQILLLFRRRALGDCTFEMRGSRWIGAEEAIVIGYRQKGGEAARVYSDKKLQRVLMAGELWVEKKSLRPARISVTIPTTEGGQAVEHLAETEYYFSGHGLVLPRAVRYRKSMGGVVLVENKASYQDYKMFQVSTEIKFTPEEAPPP